MELAAFLQALSTWLAGPAAWFLIEKIKFLQALEPDTKRYVAFALSGVIAAAGWFGLLAIGNVQAPVGAVAWISQIWLVMTSAFGLATLINAPSLRKYRSDS